MANVLLVSDDMEYRDLIDPMLEDAGHAVLQAESIDTAIELISQNPGWPNVIVCDGSYNFSERIRMANSTRKSSDGLRFIVLSGERKVDRGITEKLGDAMISKNQPATVVQYIDKVSP